MIANAAVLILAGHHDSPTSHRMKRIGYLDLEGRKPGIMAPVRMAEPFIGQSR